MRVICLSTLDKFSRFYLDIKTQLQLKTKDTVKFKICSIYFSGFLYLFVRLKYSLLISKKALILSWLNAKKYKAVLKNANTYKGITYDNYITFHEQLNVSKTALQLQALAYIDIFHGMFKTQQTDVLITIGDSRLCVEIAIAVAKTYTIKIYYIEQGPFGTTFFDSEGVNANLSIRNSEIFQPKNTKKTKFEIDINNNQKSYKRSPVYRGFDMLFKLLFENTKIYPPDLRFTDLNTFNTQKKDIPKTNLPADIPVFLLILQVPVDVNMIYHSPNFKTHAEIVKHVYNSMPKNGLLVIREHPLYINKYESELYNFTKSHNIIIDNTTTLSAMLKKAGIVIVNNSTVGFEAIINCKTVVVLGNAFYDNDAICLKLKSKTELKSLLNDASNFKPNVSKINAFKTLLCNTVLLNGSIKDEDLKSSKTIANHLLAQH